VTGIPGLAPGMTIAAVRRALAQAFRNAGLDSPELDARVLIGHALGLDHAALVSNGERALDAREAATIAAFAERRLKREPVARITGHKEFWGLDLAVTPATLVPRPETETVVETTLAAVADRTRTLCLADFGVGTGALLLALLSERGAGLSILLFPIRLTSKAMRSAASTPKCAITTRAWRWMGEHPVFVVTARLYPMRGVSLHRRVFWWSSSAPAKRRPWRS